MSSFIWGDTAMAQNRFDPITLEVLWNRLISTVNEQAAALMHASFTTVVREAGDLSAGVFDEQPIPDILAMVSGAIPFSHAAWIMTLDIWS